ncbi:MAG: hypothetical protein M1383_06330 [Patescibacteria group bacterium]|nr:hypothetical protein [Patescibacteria group bacterium]
MRNNHQKSAFKRIAPKRPEERKRYNAILKGAESLSEERTFDDEPTEGTNSPASQNDEENLKTSKVIKKSKWLTITDSLKNNILVLGGILGFVAIIVAVTIWFDGLRRDVDSMKEDIKNIQANYTQLNSDRLQDSNQIGFLKSEIQRQLDSLSSRTEQLEKKIFH